ncbi:LOW QUALITY PROTEIN: hypothetical protein Cgig2_023070 [Carnegiea gigantea]|uniref:Reverse transcriptase zinc-binding domain-containing protein n=1 Tax=Carnegiea gigantea TaxID=171969 RepID=A0A9Q1JNK3_9CARY|nr:LOW QUALITY PROTEIN: hypothetical protein Cgig2_023070 [Carnegiea gigantea]
MSSYIYTIKDAQENQMKGFDQVGQLIFDFYKQLLGKQSQSRSSIRGNITGLQDSNFPLKYLGDTHYIQQANKECRNLVEKITVKMKIWAIKSLSYAGKVVLINNVVFRMFNYWASIFILPTEVVNKITQLYKNYLWGGAVELKRVPHVSWQKACLSKECLGSPHYKVKQGYKWLMRGHEKVEWAKVIWARTNIPRHAFVNWVYIQYKLPTKIRLNKHCHQEDITYPLCKTAAEDDQHLFLCCDYAKAVGNEIKKCTKGEKQITSAIVSAAIYHIWSARNNALFCSTYMPPRQTLGQIKEQVIYRIHCLNTTSKNFIHCIDSLLK